MKASVLGLATLLAAAAMAAIPCGPAAAGPLRCRSVDGNVTCAGPGAASCQTVDGRTVCASGSGDAVQVFGGDGGAEALPKDPEDLLQGEDALPEEEDSDGAVPPAAPPRGALRIERRGLPDGAGRPSLRRRGDGALRLRTGRLSLDLGPR